MRSLQQIIHDRYEYSVRVEYSFRYRTLDASDECKYTPRYITEIQLNNCCQNRIYELNKKSRCPKAQPEVKELLYYFFSEEYHTILQFQSYKTADGESSLFSSVELPPISLIESVSILASAKKNNKSYRVREVLKDFSSPSIIYEHLPDTLPGKKSECGIIVDPLGVMYKRKHSIISSDKFLLNLSKLKDIISYYDISYDIDYNALFSSFSKYLNSITTYWKDILNCSQGKKARLLIDLFSNEQKQMKTYGLDDQCQEPTQVNADKLKIFEAIQNYSKHIMNMFDLMVKEADINFPEINPQLPLYEHLGELCNIVRPYIGEVEVGIIKPLRGHSIGEIEMGKLYDELQFSKEIISKKMKRGEFIYWMTGKKQEGVIPDQKHLPMQVSMDYRTFVLLFDVINLNKWTILSQLFKLDEGILDPDDMKRSASDMRRSLRKSDSARVNHTRLLYVKTYYHNMFDPYSNVYKYLKDDYRNYF